MNGHARRTRPSSSVTRAVRAVLAPAVGLALALAPAAVASAHGGNGSLALDSFSAAAGAPDDGNVWDISVVLTYAGDGDPVDDATVTVSGGSDSGQTLTPVTLSPAGDGVFSGTVTLPAEGAWNLQVTSVEPPAQLALEPVVVGQVGVEALAGGEAPASSTTAGTANSTATDGSPADDGTAAGAEEGADGGVSAGLVLAAVGALVVLAVGAFAFTRRTARALE